jgi:hypothetical protein
VAFNQQLAFVGKKAVLLPESLATLRLLCRVLQDNPLPVQVLPE